jgi:hypothetical protein
MDTLIISQAPGRNQIANIRVGNERATGEYTLAENDWSNDYVIPLRRDFEALRENHPAMARAAIRREVADATSAFRTWLSEDVVGPSLDPKEVGAKSSSLTSLRKALQGLRQDINNVRTFFGHDRGLNARVPTNNETRFKPLADIEARISEQYARLLNPKGEAGPGLSLLQNLIVLVASVAVGYLVWSLGLSEAAIALRAIGAVGAGLVTASAMRWLLLKQSRPLEVLRKEAEDGLKDLYNDYFYRQAADILFPEIAGTFCDGCEAALTEAMTRLDDLLLVYRELQGRARARVSEASKPPLHSVDQVGENITLPNDEREFWADQLAVVIRARTVYGQTLSDLTLDIRATAPVKPYFASITRMAHYVRNATSSQTAGSIPGQAELETIDSTLDEMGSLVLKDYLPTSFRDALLREASNEEEAIRVLSAKVARLMHRQVNGELITDQTDRRSPSLNVTVERPTVRMLIVPDEDVRALVNQTRTRLPGIEGELDNYMSDKTNATNKQGEPWLVPAVGPSIVAVSIWIPNNILDTEEANDAKRTYYGLAQTMGDPDSASFLNQKRWNFQILPELVAAADIELSQTEIGPLHPLITARLLGNDPSSGGPTLLELYYLLRSRGQLFNEDDPTINTGQGRRERTVIEMEGVSRVVILTRPLVYGDPGRDTFGAGRATVDEYDAFAQFMLYSGAAIGMGDESQSGLIRFMGGVELALSEWAALGPEGISRIQRAVVDTWYNVMPEDIEKDTQEMLALVARDAATMPYVDGAQKPVALPSDWQRALRTLIGKGAQKRKTLHRNAARRVE